MNIQAFIAQASAEWRAERQEGQMTLKKLIVLLESMPEGFEIDCLIKPHSYRGYYEDLSFERGIGKEKASDFLKDVKKLIGKVFTGYKGGEFYMDENTPVWVAEYGCTGEKLIGFDEDGTLQTESDD